MRIRPDHREHGTGRPPADRPRAGSTALRVLAAVALAVSVLALAGAPASASGITVVTQTGGQVLFIRPAPNQSSAPLGSYGDGASVRVDCFITNGQFITGPTASSMVWHRLNGRTGWVSGVYLQGGAFGGVAGEPRCAGGGGPYALPARYTVRNSCGLADITFLTRTQEMSVQVKPGKAPAVLASGYRCLADSLIVNWVSPQVALKWRTYLRNEIRNHALGYVVLSSCAGISAKCANGRSHSNPADIDFRDYPYWSRKAVQWKTDWTAIGITSAGVIATWILL